MKKFIFRCFTLIIALLSLNACSIFGGSHHSRDEFKYSVDRGDTLYELAYKYTVSVDEIVRRNNLKNPDKLEVGQILIIPASFEQEIPSGGPYISADKVIRERAKVVMPPLDSLNIKMSMPIQNAKIGSRFGARGSRFHEGLDILAEEGHSIFAAHDGVVIFSGKKLSGYGNMVVVKRDQIMTLYAHNSRNIVEVGDEVARGDKLAEVGSTGRATGPHLHFEARVKANNNRYYAVDPLYFIR